MELSYYNDYCVNSCEFLNIKFQNDNLRIKFCAGYGFWI